MILKKVLLCEEDQIEIERQGDISAPIKVALNIFAQEKYKHIPVKDRLEFKYMLTPNDVLYFFSCNSSKSVLNLPPAPYKETREINGG
jgi:hypothetical protein